MRSSRFQTLLSMYNIKTLSILLCILMVKIFWDQAQLKALEGVVETVYLATHGTDENVLLLQAKHEKIQLAKQNTDFLDRFGTKYIIYNTSFAFHELLWYKVVIYIDPKTKKVERSEIHSDL